MPETITRTRKPTVVRPSGVITGRAATGLRDVLLALHHDGVREYVIDLTAVESIDRTGLSVLYRAWRRAVWNGGGLTLAGPQAGVREALEAMRFPAAIVEGVPQRTLAVA